MSLGLILFGIAWLVLIFAVDYLARKIHRKVLMDDIEQYLTWVEAEQKEDDGNGY